MKSTIFKTIVLLSALTLIFSMFACGGDTDTDNTTAYESTTAAESVTDGVTVPESEEFSYVEASSEAADDESTAPSEDTTEAETTEEDSGAPKTKAEVIAYCNTALNNVKSSKAGFTKAHLMTAQGDVSGIPQFVVNVVEKDKTTTFAKGDSKIIDEFPAGGFTWSSKLTENDVKTYDFKEDGKYYIIKLRLGSEVNPAKNDTSTYGRCMSVIDAAGAKEMLSAVKTIKMTYHDGYIYAKIDSTTGKIVNCEFSASADIEATISLVGDIAVKDIVSTETFSSFVW